MDAPNPIPPAEPEPSSQPTTGSAPEPAPAPSPAPVAEPEAAPAPAAAAEPIPEAAPAPSVEPVVAAGATAGVAPVQDSSPAATPAPNLEPGPAAVPAPSPAMPPLVVEVPRADDAASAPLPPAVAARPEVSAARGPAWGTGAVLWAAGLAAVVLAVVAVRAFAQAGPSADTHRTRAQARPRSEVVVTRYREVLARVPSCEVVRVRPACRNVVPATCRRPVPTDRCLR